MTEDPTQTRRKFLKATGGIATAIAVAGCTGGGDSTDTEAATDTDTEAPTATEASTATEAQATAGEGTSMSGDTSMADETSMEGGTTEGDATEGGGATEDGTESTSGGGEPQEGGTLQLINSSITTFDPIRATDTASGTVIQQMFDSLMNYPNGRAAVETQIAADYETNDDFTQYTFTLKEGVPFHNGDEVTANDFLFSFRRLAESENSRRAYFILDSLSVPAETTDDGTVVPDTLGVEAPGDYELVLNLESPFAQTLEMLAYTSFAAVPEGIVGDIEGYDGEMEQSAFATENPIGAGPFTFGSWEQGTAAEVSQFPEYHGQVAYLDGIHWQTIEDSNAAYNYSMNRNSDLISIPTPQYQPNKITVENENDIGGGLGTYGPLRNGATANYYSLATLGTFYVGFNMEAVPKPVRQAVAYMTNQQLVAEDIFKQRAEPAYMFTPPTIYPGGAEAYTQKAESEYPYGYNEALPQEAISVMEDAGYGPNNQFELTFTQYAGSPTWNQTAQILRDRLTQAHVRMSIEQAQFSTLTERVREGNMQAYTLGWIADWPAPDNFLQLLNPPQTDTSQPAPISGINWSSETGDAAQQAADAYQTVVNNLAPTDEAEQTRNEAYIAMEEANWEDVGFLNMYNELDERFWYDTVHVEPFGAMGGSRQMHNRTWKEQ